MDNEDKQPQEGEARGAEDIQNDAARCRRDAARLMGQIRSSKKSEASRLNGRLGGRPKGQMNDEATRERMREAQRKRRQNERDT